MKTLAQYLAEYLDYESDKGFAGSYPDGSVYFDRDCLKAILEQGIEAYQLTENCTITVIANAVDCEHCRKCGEITCGNDTTHYSCFEPLR